ncbi:MAG: phage integrase SAM-like domain-containing protein [Pirellulales bacterium]|nr:phage integrase SAM-like domain-containing protein [Pirellulales bacterium]
MATLRGSSWYGVVRVPGVKVPVRKSFGTSKDSAESWENACRRAIANGLPIPDSSQMKGAGSVGTFFEDAFEYLWANKKGDQKKWYQIRGHIKYFGGDLPVSAIDYAAIVRFTNFWSATNRASSVNGKLSDLKMILEHAVDCGHISQVPKIKFLKALSGRLRFLTDSERGQLLQAFRHLGFENEYQLTVFLLEQGNRICETVQRVHGDSRRIDMQTPSVEWSDISVPFGTAPRITINNQDGTTREEPAVTFWRTKNGSYRTVPLTPLAGEVLKYTRALGWDKPFSEITYEGYYSAFQKVREFLGFADDREYVPHILRHTCA